MIIAIVVWLVWFVWAVLYFIYHFMLAPGFQVSLELQLCQLRDEVILLKAECVNPAAELDCSILLESIKFMIAKLRRIRVSSLIFIELESKKVPGFLANAQERARMLDESTGSRVRLLHERALDIGIKALAVNSIAWAILLVAPSAIAAARRRLSVLTSLSVREFEQATPWDHRRWHGRIKNA